MLALIFTVIFGIIIAYFATQNTTSIGLHFASYSWSGIPVYLVVLLSLLIGLLFAWLLHVLTSISSSLTIRGKDHALTDLKRENSELTKQVHQLELENSKLATKEETIIERNAL